LHVLTSIVKVEVKTEDKKDVSFSPLNLKLKLFFFSS